MEDNKNVNFETEEPWIITLTDDETGEDQDFEVIAQGEVDGKNYLELFLRHRRTPMGISSRKLRSRTASHTACSTVAPMP